MNKKSLRYIVILCFSLMLLLVETEAVVNPAAIIGEAVCQFVRNFAVSFSSHFKNHNCTFATEILFQNVTFFKTSQIFIREQGLKIANMSQEEVERLNNM